MAFVKLEKITCNLWKYHVMRSKNAEITQGVTNEFLYRIKEKKFIVNGQEFKNVSGIKGDLIPSEFCKI